MSGKRSSAATRQSARSASTVGLRQHAKPRKPRPGVEETVGRAYSEGRLTLDEVGSILGLERSDVAFWLQERGYTRSRETVGLPPEERARVLQALADRRLPPGATPIVDRERVRREVITTQRIEDVDVRRWLPRPGG